MELPNFVQLDYFTFFFYVKQDYFLKIADWTQQC